MNKLTIGMSTLGFLVMPKVSAMLGVSPYAAKVAIDSISKGASAWAIAAILVVGLAFGGLGFFAFKKVVLLIGQKAAIAW